MSCILYKKNKKTGITYAYESVSYRDPVTKQPRSRRTYLGRVNPETNEIIPKAGEGRRNRSSVTGEIDDDKPEKLKRQISILEEQNARQREEIGKLKDELDALRKKETAFHKLLLRMKNEIDEMI